MCAVRLSMEGKLCRGPPSASAAGWGARIDCCSHGMHNAFVCVLACSRLGQPLQASQARSSVKWVSLCLCSQVLAQVRLLLLLSFFSRTLNLICHCLPSSPPPPLIATMKEEPKHSTEVVELDDAPAYRSPSGEASDAEAVKKLGVTPTIPRTLERLIGLIGVNSSVVCPWP